MKRSFRPFRSVRARTALFATAVVALALVVAGTAVVWALRGNLVSQADLQAEVTARDIASQIAVGTPYDKLELPDGDGSPVQVVDPHRRVRAVGEGLQAITVTSATAVTPVAAPAPAATAPRSSDDDHDDDRDDDNDDRNDDNDDRDDHENGDSDDNDDNDGDDDSGSIPGRGEVSGDVDHMTGRATVNGRTADYRFAAVRATSPFGETATVYAGAPLATEQRAVRTVVTAMLIGLPLLLAVVAGVTWLTTRRALRPVEDIRAELSAITASSDLARRVPEPDSHDEIARLAATTNRTLAALEASVEQQRRFVADASHELRSPIASLRTQLEVAAAHPELLDLEGAVQDTVRLQDLAADLLLLARLDAGEQPQAVPLDLDDLVREEAARRADALPVRVTLETPVRVDGSRSRLARVLRNLLDNAQRHATGSVTVTLHTEGTTAVLRVADDGPGVPVAERERIFERFVRLDDARTRDDGGAGLGLAIVRDVVRRHGGDITVGDAPGGGALFEVRLPLSEDHRARESAGPVVRPEGRTGDEPKAGRRRD
ncbi:HAMP domain-containing sensor histidine kinase [Streptomyces thermogriseus]|uniref:histidine kinase n=1 Tax=Streptomyces thermogriseus TaxID=75292 RepID=A0ABN1SU21_9ACTN